MLRCCAVAGSRHLAHYLSAIRACSGRDVRRSIYGATHHLRRCSTASARLIIAVTDRARRRAPLRGRRRASARKVAHLPHRDLAGAKFGLINAAFVVFTLVVTDLACQGDRRPVHVLATDAYKQVVGQQNFEMGAVAAWCCRAACSLRDRPHGAARQVALLWRAPCARAEAEHQARYRADDLLPRHRVILVGVLGTRSGRRSSPTGRQSHADAQELDFGNFDPAAGIRISPPSRWRRARGVRHRPSCSPAPTSSRRQDHAGGRMIAHLLAMLPMAVPGLVLGLGYCVLRQREMESARVSLRHARRAGDHSVAHFYTVAHITR